MKYPTLIATGALALLLSLAAPAQSQQVSVETVPPVVIKTVPEAGAADVDPKLAEIQVTFSKEMMDKSWSWSTLSQDSFPKLNGKPKYLPDQRTCSVSVSLEPGKTYAIWLNSAKFHGFTDVGGRAAVPYLLVFKTKN